MTAPKINLRDLTLRRVFDASEKVVQAAVPGTRLTASDFMRAFREVMPDGVQMSQVKIVEGTVRVSMVGPRGEFNRLTTSFPMRKAEVEDGSDPKEKAIGD